MQKSTTLLWGLMLAGVTQAACVQQYGSLTCGSGEVDAVHASGHVVLKDTTVRQSVEVSGHMEAQSSHLPVVHVQGAVTFSQCTIAKSCRVEGGLVARDTSFAGPLDIYANQATLDNVHAEQINMHHDGRATTVLSITGNSHIRGDIHIVPSGATIKVGPQVQIVGSIIGATVIKGDQ